MSDQDQHLQDLVADVAAAYFTNAHVAVQDIPQVISQIAASLAAVGMPVAGLEVAVTAGSQVPEPPKKLTAAQWKRSIRNDGLISFEDGRSYKTLKRHLSVRGLTPAEYVEKHGLPSDYPMVSPAYSAQRSALAKSLGLGAMGRTKRASATSPVKLEVSPAKVRGKPGPKPKAKTIAETNDKAAPAKRGRKPRVIAA